MSEQYPCPPGPCPTCHQELNAATPPYGEPRAPAAGDVGVCIYCGEVHSFRLETGALVRVPATPELLEELARDPAAARQVSIVQALIRTARARAAAEARAKSAHLN